jgi:thiol:disulfide interchange protein DsbG
MTLPPHPADRRRFLLQSTLALATAALAACGEKSPPAAATPGAANSAGTSAAAGKPSGRESYELASQGHGFTMGPMMAANTVYVFFDATCPHCAALWMSAKPLLKRVKMVWMPIGLLHRSSTPQGATILSAADPAAAMTENETSVLERRGGITVASSLSDDVLAQVKANTDLFNKLGADSVPLIVYRNAKTGEFGSHSGAVSADELAAMAGV